MVSVGVRISGSEPIRGRVGLGLHRRHTGYACPTREFSLSCEIILDKLVDCSFFREIIKMTK